MPIVSVIVPVRDDAAGIRKLIDRLAGQTLPRDCFEIVIGDDGSTHGSLTGIETSDGWVRVCPAPRRTSYAARNAAASAARGRVLAFCDADCRPEPTWLEAGLAALANADVAAGEVSYVAPARPSAWSLLTIDTYLDQERNVLRSRAVTANLFVTRRLFQELGGFDPSLPSGGDYDFARRAVERGARLDYAAAAVVRHPTLDDRRTFLRKVWRTNRSGGLRRGRAGQPPDLYGVLRFVPIVNGVKSRDRALRPRWRLQGRRLAASGARPSPAAELRAMVTFYVVVKQVAVYARMRGWREGRRLARDCETADREFDSGRRQAAVGGRVPTLSEFGRTGTGTRPEP